MPFPPNLDRDLWQYFRATAEELLRGESDPVPDFGEHTGEWEYIRRFHLRRKWVRKRIREIAAERAGPPADSRVGELDRELAEIMTSLVDVPWRPVPIAHQLSMRFSVTYNAWMRPPHPELLGFLSPYDRSIVELALAMSRGGL